MDSSALRRAYAALLEAADTAAATLGTRAAPPGEWDAAQLLAHVAAVDAGVSAAACAVAAGVPGRFDNRSSMDAANLARIARAAGDLAGLAVRVRAQGEVVCALAEQLTEDELATTVPTVLVDGEETLVEGPVPVGDLLRGLADDHLPRHTTQLVALLP